MDCHVIERERRSPTLHDFPYRGEQRKCYHKWIVNVTPPGRGQCLHSCLYCYARDAVYSRNREEGLVVYSNLADMVEKELSRLSICPPLSISNVTDPCQDVPELRKAVEDLVSVLTRWGVSFHIITKGDPSFLSKVEGFPGKGRFFLAVTVEGPPEVLQALSPSAPDYESRLASLGWASRLGLPALVRLDPIIPPLWRSLFGGSWLDRVGEVLDDCASAGAGHVVASTGRFTSSTLADIKELVGTRSPSEEELMSEEYSFDRSYTASGYMLQPSSRLDLHLELRRAAEERGMTYAVCQELRPEQADSPGLPHCEAFPMPFSARTGPTSFEPIAGCDSNCHVSCYGLSGPPCGRPELARPEPFKPSMLR